MFNRKTILSFVLVSFVASVGVAQDDAATKKGKRGNKGKQKSIEFAYKQLLKPFESVNLTDEQTEQAKKLLEPNIEKYAAAKKAFNKCLTKEQSTSLKEAMKKAWADGLKGREVQEAKQAAMSAMNLSDEKKNEYETLQSDLNAMTTKLKESVMTVLTDEQKEAMPKRKGKKGGKGKGGKKGKGKTDDEA